MRKKRENIREAAELQLQKSKGEWRETLAAEINDLFRVFFCGAELLVSII